MLAPATQLKKQTISFMLSGKTDHIPSLAPRVRLSLRQLEVFAATARCGSTRAAAELVSRSQSAASAALAELERVLGAPLFDRVGRRLVLNESGRALLPRASAILEQAMQLEREFAGGHDAPLRVAASLTIGEYLLPERIARWKKAHPDSAVHLTVGNSAKVIRALVDRDVDLGFIEGPQSHPDLLVRRWLEDELVIVAAHGHALAGRIATPRALADAAWILREPDSGTRQFADAWLLEHLGPLRVEFELGSTEAIKRLAATGAGLACVSRHAVGFELASGTLVELRTRLPRSRRRLAMVVRRDGRCGPSAQAFMAQCAG
jgi:DNA-binding transcriptional LysR family regulator